MSFLCHGIDCARQWFVRDERWKGYRPLTRRISLARRCNSESAVGLNCMGWSNIAHNPGALPAV